MPVILTRTDSRRQKQTKNSRFYRLAVLATLRLKQGMITAVSPARRAF